MGDQKKIVSPDRERINVNESDEVDYWTALFDVTKVKLKAAVNAAGTAVKDVEAYLKKR
jgi:hypothetical protein